MKKVTRVGARQETGAPGGRAAWWAPLLVLAAGMAAYGNSLGGAFLFDDFGSIVRNSTIQDLSSWQVLAPPADSAVAGRPLVNLSFAVNHALGGADPWGYHVVNIALHILCGLLVLALARRALSAGPALAIALLWTVHPLNSEVVNYLTQRTESMMAACFLITLYAAGAQGPGRARWQTVAVIACAAGAMCKETIAVAPLAVLLYDSVYVFGSAAAAVRVRWRFYACLAATWLLLGGLVAADGQSFTAGFASASVSTSAYLLSQAVMVVRYMQLVVWPQDLVLYYGWSRPMALAEVWPYVLTVAGLIAATLVALWRRPKVGAVAAWVFLTLGPTSSLIPIATEVGAERRMYLPLIGLIVLAVIGAAWVWERLGDAQARPRWAPTLAVALVSVVLAATTRARNQDYATALTMAETIAARWPTPNAHQLVGTELIRVGRHQDAIPHLREGADGYPVARYFLGEALLRTGQATEAIGELLAFMRAEPYIMQRNAHLLLAQAYSATGQPAQAIDQLKAVIAVAPDDATTHAMLADLLAERQAFAEAIPHYEAFLAANPRNTNALTGLGVALVATGKAAGAVAAFRSAVEADPRHSRLRQNLARALLDQGDTAAALTQAQEAVTLGSADPAALEVLGHVLARLGRIADARLTFRRALQLDPNYAPAIAGLRAVTR